MKTVDIEVIGEGVIAIEVDATPSITTSDYDLLINKPSANGILLKGKVEVTTYITNEEMNDILKF